MPAIALDLGEYDLPAKNRLATQTIERYATNHAAADAGLGLLGFLPIPGAATASIAAALSIQIPIYKFLAADLAQIYSAPVRDHMVQGIVKSGIALDSAAAVGTDLLVNEFGGDFASEIGGELMSEVGIGFGVSLIPFLGGFVSMALDVAIAVTMTWRVGTMVSMYYQYGERWIGDRHKTYENAKGMTGGLSPEIRARVDLDAIPKNQKPIFKYQTEQYARFLKALIDAAPDITDDKLRSVLAQRGLPKEMAEEAIRLARASS